MRKRTSNIIQLAKKNKIDIIGKVDLDVLSSFGEGFSRLKDEKVPFFDGELIDRIDYLKVWGETRSILSFGVYYNQYVKKPDEQVGRAKISKSAYGTDYHRVLKTKATNFMEEVKMSFPCEYKIYVDTGMLSDRALAYSAGLGFFGKNGFIINEEYGSYIFLGHILIDREIDIDYIKPIEQKCADCERCIKACVKNIVSGGKTTYFDCLSYLSQVGKAEKQYGYIYGCDLCQEVCPYNEVRHKVSEEFNTTSELAYPKVEQLVKLTNSEFKKLYGSSALFWRRFKNIKLNCANFIDEVEDENI